MELTDILIDLSNSKAALEVVNHTIRRLNGKCMRKNLVIIGLAWLSMKACTMLGESEKKRKEAEERARNAETRLFEEQRPQDVCCDGKARIDKKEV